MIFGTHTHIPTADARILPGGTASITDLGMCGPYDSVLGRRKDRVLKHMTTNMPHPFEIATGDVRLCGALAEIDLKTGRATSMEPHRIRGKMRDQAYDSDDKAGERDRGSESIGQRMKFARPQGFNGFAEIPIINRIPVANACSLLPGGISDPSLDHRPMD